MIKLESKQNFRLSAFFDKVNSKFDNYACSSSIYNSAGLYILITTVYMFVSSNSHHFLFTDAHTNRWIIHQQSCNIYRFIYMILERTRIIEQNPSNNLYEFTKLSIFQDIPSLNLNLYDIVLATQYFEVLRLYWLFQNIMQVVFYFISF